MCFFLCVVFLLLLFFFFCFFFFIITLLLFLLCFFVVVVFFFVVVFGFLLRLYFSEKIRLDISCESSAEQTIHMKCRLIFSDVKSYFL